MHSTMQKPTLYCCSGLGTGLSFFLAMFYAQN